MWNYKVSQLIKHDRSFTKDFSLRLDVHIVFLMINALMESYVFPGIAESPV